jgi:Notch-like protein
VIDDVWGEISYKFCQCYEGIPRTDEICDGIDNDCDGLVDNGISSCGCSFDVEVGSEYINQLAVLLNNQKIGGEMCNNVDDDCNGLIDDDIEGKCFCTGGFDGNPAARPEFCNGVDDDCDGIIDNVAFTETCGCFEGENESGTFDEICDNKDNDCNGLIDEEWLSLGSICGFGLCDGGVYECSSDQQSVRCSTEIGGSEEQAVDEVCGNDVDDDCNSLTDENCICDQDGEERTCSTNEGECVEGVQKCTGGDWSSCIGGTLPVAETCDGSDEDCNGVVDDLDACACYGGSQGGQETCNGIDDNCDGIIDNVDGKTSVESTQCGCYDGLYGKGAQIEYCNRIDDDCDGVIDDVKDGESVPATRCACYNGEDPGVESCNKIDDDCDGEIDEDWVTLGDTCGLGICTGTYVCSDDEETVLCNGAAPETEVCDSKDNDCDGNIDEGCTEGPGAGSSCENGIQDGNEEGVDCGGQCPIPCPGTRPPGTQGEGTWMIVFAVLVGIIIIVGLLLVFFKQ